MDKIKRFIDCYIPNETCNLRCHYCYITQRRKFNNKLAAFSKSKDIVRKALSKERLGGACLLNMCAGGETLLAEDLLPIIRCLLEEGHYVMVVTNGTLTKRFESISMWPKELLEHLFFKFSFHYLELKRLKLLDQYFNNIEMMKKSGASFTVEITPSDELIPHIEDVKKICLEKLGTLCHVTIARDDRTEGIEVLTEHSFEEYQKTWGQFSSDLFEYKKSIFYKKRKEFCYAGDWSFYLNLETGMMKQCYCGKILGNIYDDLDKKLPLEAIGNQCTQPHCYNGHAFLTLGVIPELESPCYAQVRNRVSGDGSEWLMPKMKAFMSSKLFESNEEYTSVQKMKLQGKNLWRRTYQKAGAVKRKLFG